jgi:putative addiction module CopG family antidote
MELSISEQIHERIRRKVDSGKYSSPDEVLEKALESLDEREEALAEEFAEIEARLAVADEQIAKGQLKPAHEVFDRLLKRNAERPR